MSNVEKSRTKFFEKINKEHNKALHKIAKTPVKTEIRSVRVFRGGQAGFDGVTNVIKTNAGITVYAHTVALYYKAYGLMGPILHEPMKCYCGTIIEKSVPSTTIVKEIKSGFHKKACFLPYTSGRYFSAKQSLQSKTNWNPLIDLLNGDNNLSDWLGKMPIKTQITGVDSDFNAGRYKSFNVEINDQDENSRTICQIVPLGERTLIATCHVAQDLKSIEHAVNAIIRIHQIISNFRYAEVTKAEAADDWANSVLSLIEQEAPQEKPRYRDEGELKPKPTLTISTAEIPPPPPVPENQQTFAKCLKCGRENPIESKFCNICGSPLKPEEISCPKCGRSNPHDSKFCGNCGSSLANPAAVAQNYESEKKGLNVAGQPAMPSLTRPEQYAFWRIVLGTEKQVMGATDLHNVWEAKWSATKELFGELLRQIKLNKHYSLYPGLKEVRSPKGARTVGGMFLLTVKFKKKVPEALKEGSFQLLCIGSKQGGAELMGTNDVNLRRETYLAILETASKNPREVESLNIIMPFDA